MIINLIAGVLFGGGNAKSLDSSPLFLRIYSQSKSRVKSTSLQQRSNSFISGAPNPRLDFCRFPGRSLIPPTSPKRGGRVHAFFFRNSDR